METTTNIEPFYRLSHLSISLIGGIIMIMIWSHVKKLLPEKEKDWGLFFIALAFIAWAGMDLFKLDIFMDILEETKKSKGNSPNTYAEFQERLYMPYNVFIIRMFSTFNNMFFIAALPFFHYGFEKIKEKVSFLKNGTIWIIISLVSAILFIMLLSYLAIALEAKDNVQIIEFGFSLITILLIGWAIFQSFRQRGYGKWFLLFVLLTIIFVIITQIPFTFEYLIKTEGQKSTAQLLLLISHTTLIILFLILAQSWIVEKNTEKYEQIITAKTKSYNLLLEKNETLNTQTHKMREEIENKLKNYNSLTKENSNLTNRVHKMKEEIESITKQLKNHEKINISKLSPREYEVFEVFAQDKSYTEMGKQLNNISRETVIVHKKSIEQKLNIKGKDKLVELAKNHFDLNN